jgi:hypothetical protein
MDHLLYSQVIMCIGLTHEQAIAHMCRSIGLFTSMPFRLVWRATNTIHFSRNSSIKSSLPSFKIAAYIVLYFLLTLVFLRVIVLVHKRANRVSEWVDLIWLENEGQYCPSAPLILELAITSEKATATSTDLGWCASDVPTISCSPRPFPPHR